MAKKSINDQEAADEAQKYADKVSEDDVSRVMDKEEKLNGLFAKIGALKKYVDDARDILCLLRDRATGKYTETPWSTIAALVGALVYVLSPLDVIPDLVPMFGYMDDAAVMGYIVHTFAVDDLAKYRAWKQAQESLKENTIDV